MQIRLAANWTKMISETRVKSLGKKQTKCKKQQHREKKETDETRDKLDKHSFGKEKILLHLHFLAFVICFVLALCFCTGVVFVQLRCVFAIVFFFWACLICICLHCMVHFQACSFLSSEGANSRLSLFQLMFLDVGWGYTISPWQISLLPSSANHSTLAEMNGCHSFPLLSCVFLTQDLGAISTRQKNSKDWRRISRS